MHQFNVYPGLVKIPVSDMKTAVSYYRDTLGLEEIFCVPEYGWAQFACGSLPLCLYQPKQGVGMGQPGSFDSLHLYVDDVYAAYHTLQNNGANLYSKLEQSHDDHAFFEVADLDGNVLKILQAPKGTDDDDDDD